MTIVYRHLRTAARSLTAAALLCGAGTALAQSAATIPSGLQGTYKLTFGSAQPGSPLANGATVDMVIAPGGTICIADYLLANPVTHNGNAAEARWGVPSLGVKLAMSNIGTSSFSKLGLLSMTDQSYGQFTFNKISNSTSCSFLGGPPQNTSTVADIFRLAEHHYAELFPAASFNHAYQIIEGYIARHYVGTGTYIGIKDNKVYVLGGEFGNTPVTIDTVANTLAMLKGLDPFEEVDVDIPEGNYNLRVSGTATSMGVTTPLVITMQDIPAPSSAQVHDLENYVRDAIENNIRGLENFVFSDFRVSEISVTNQRVFFRTQFRATGTTSTAVGNITVTTTYNLTFEFLKK